jgi:hypothetical protein
MRYRWLLAGVVAVLLTSVAAVYAAPFDQQHGSTPIEVRAPLPGVRQAAGAVHPPDASIGRPAPAPASRLPEGRLDQSLWVGVIDDFEEGSEPSVYRGWVLNEDTNRAEYGEYKWGISDCRAKSGRRSLWAIGDGADGKLLTCGSPYPHGVSSSIWLRLDLSHWPTDTQRLELQFDYWLNLRTNVEGGVEPDGLFVSYMLPITGAPDTHERIVLINYTAQDPSNFWYEPGVVDLMRARSVYPDKDGNFREFNLAGQKEVYIEFLFQTAREPFEVKEDGAFIDNVRLVSNVAGPTGTVIVPTETGTPPPVTTEPPPTSETPSVTATTPGVTPPPGTTLPPPTTVVPPTVTAPPGDFWVYLPAALRKSDFALAPPGNTPAPPTEPPPASPTPVPTEPEPTASAAPPGPLDCQDWIVNGGFEAGAASGWTFEHNVTDPGYDFSKALVRYADVPQMERPPDSGDVFAFLGNGLNVDMKLSQSEARDVLPADRVVSATLQFDLGVQTDEVPDGTSQDGFIIALIDQENKVEPVGAITEESPGLVNDAWMRWQIGDFAQYVIQRTGWETMRLQLRSVQNDSHVTIHVLDNVSLTVCQSITPLAGARSTGRRPVLVGHALPGVPMPRWTRR